MAIANFPWKAKHPFNGSIIEVNHSGDWNFGFSVTDKGGNVEQFNWTPSQEEVRDLTVRKNDHSKIAQSAIQLFWTMYND